MPHKKVSDSTPVGITCPESVVESSGKPQQTGENDCHPFGMQMRERSYDHTGMGYRYGFNQKELDPEGMGGGGSTYDYGFRIYNPQIARFLSVDPLMKSYPWYTPYQFAGNKPIENIDLDGLEEYSIKEHTFSTVLRGTVIHKIDYQYIRQDQRNDQHMGTGTGFKEAQDVLNTQYRPGYFQDNAPLDLFYNIQNSFYKEIKEHHRQNQRPTGTVNIAYQAELFYSVDQGRTIDQAGSVFNSLSTTGQEHIDGMVCILAKDPNRKMNIVGYASSKPTNIGGEKDETTIENNVELANMRANAGKEFIVKWAQDKYGVDISSQISTSSAVRDSNPESDNSQTDRKVEFNLTP